MPVLFKTYRNNNPQSQAYGKYYGKVVATKTMSYGRLCKHMSEHNSVYGEDVCSGVAIKLTNCILEQLLEGKKVKFGELGTFYLAAKTTGVDEEKDFSVSQNIKGLYLRFAPSRQDINDLTSKTLKKRASFMNVKDLVTSKADADADDEGGDDNDGGNDNPNGDRP